MGRSLWLHTWTSLRKCRLTSQVGVVPGLCLGLCPDAEMAPVKHEHFTLGTGWGEWQFSGLNSFGVAPLLGTRHQGGRGRGCSPGCCSLTTVTKSDWFRVNNLLVFPHSSAQMKSSLIWTERIAQVNPRVCLREVKHGRKVIWKACCWEIYWVQTGERWERGEITVQKTRFLSAKSCISSKQVQAISLQSWLYSVTHFSFFLLL